MTEVDHELGRAVGGLSGGPSPALMRRLSERFDEEGLLDVAYAQVDSPLGPLTLAASARGLLVVAYPDRPLDTVLEWLAREVSPRVLEAPKRLDPVRRELDEYFEGRLRKFTTTIDWALTRGFGKKVLQSTARIPYGEVRTYGQVAESAGSARAVRAAGNGLGSNPMPVVVPCHRVVRTGGGLGGYTGGLESKKALLAIESA